MLINNIILIGIGGFIGSIARYLIGIAAHRFFDIYWFPVGTLAVNVMGCFLIGLLGGIFELRQLSHPEVRFFVFTGLLGGFTTFSAFGYETFNLFKDGYIALSVINSLLQLFVGLGAVWIGDAVSRLL